MPRTAARASRYGAAVILLSASLWGCAGVDAGQPAADSDAPRCVRLVNINGYTVIDARHVLLNGSASRHYLVTTRARCSGLTYGARIATTFGDNARLCAPFIEALYSDDGWRCPIASVEEVDSPEAARALIDARSLADDEG